MTSFFGGAQTVPQTQLTNQNFNQTQTGVQNQSQAQGYAANPFAQQQGQWVMDWMGSLAHNADQFSQPMPGLSVAGLTPGQETGISSLTNAGYGAGNALVPAGQQGIINAGQGITPDDVNQFYNPMAGNVTANLQDIFNQQNLAGRVGGTASTGGVGGDRAAVSQALLAKQQGLSAGQTYAGLYQSALQAAQQQKAQQLQAGQAALQGGFGAYGQGLQAASIPQAQEQAVNQARYQQQLGQYQDPFLKLSALTGGLPSIAGLGGAGVSATSGTTQQGTTGAQTGMGNASTTYPAPPALGQVAGLGSLALGAGMLFGGSDKRAKTDIQKYGKDKETGLPMYAFRYKGDPKTYPKVVGPMAQDIKKKYPDAVKQYAEGGRTRSFSPMGAPGPGGEMGWALGYLPHRKDVFGPRSESTQAEVARRGIRRNPAPSLLESVLSPQPGEVRNAVRRGYSESLRQTGEDYAAGGRLQRFEYGGGADDYSMQSQGDDAYSNYADTGDQNQGQDNNAQDGGQGGGGGGPPTPYQQTGDTWNLKKIFSPDRMKKTSQAIMLAQKAAQQSQVARPRVAPITFPQVPWKQGITFARGGRMAVHPHFMHLPGMRRMPSLPSIRGMRQEGGRVDARTAASWGGNQRMDVGNAPLVDFVDPNSNLATVLKRMQTTARRSNPGGIPFPVGRALGGKIRGYDDGGPVDDTMPWIDPEPESDHAPPGQPGLEGDEGDTLDPIPEISGVPLPTGRPPGAGPGAGPGAAPFRPGGGGGGGGLPGAAGQTLFGKPVSPGAMALVQAGLGMLAASGQRDSHGLPMSGLGAVGAGGLAGMKSYQSDIEQQRKDVLSRQGMGLRQQALEQSLNRQNADLELRREIAKNNEEYRKAMLEQRSGENKPFTVKGLYGDKTVIKRPDGTFEEVQVTKPGPGVGPSPSSEPAGSSSPAEAEALSFSPAETDEQKQVVAEVMGERGASKKSPFKSPANVEPDLLKAMGMTPETFDILAIRLAKGDAAVAQAGGTKAVATMFKRALQGRATQYWQDKLAAMGAGPEEAAQAANDAVVEFQARKSGARAIANREGNITTALSRAEATAPILAAASDKVNRTQYSDINKIIIAAKQRTGNEDVVRYGLALETFIRNYASAMGQGSTVLTDTSQKLIQQRLNEAYSKGQIRATVDQALLEINRELSGTQKGMDYYLGRKQGAAGFEGTTEPSKPASSPSGVARPTSRAEYEALAPGTHYIGRDGQERTKQ